jgi:inner membrane protein
MLPDLDVIAFQLQIPYSHPLGHRGLSHSFLFAMVVAPVVAWIGFRSLRLSTPQWLAVLGLCTVGITSHGLLDALTDGGLGIGFFVPLDSTRYFFPIRPLKVSPLGLSSFVEGPGVAVLRSEFIYVWLPLAAAVVLARLTVHWRRPA